ncbi:MAG: hypothetical protein WC564_03610 [Patescibacteria group bacterium]|jgi:SMC interacting uncharacterized protein involved in chromosome segregation
MGEKELNSLIGEKKKLEDKLSRVTSKIDKSAEAALAATQAADAKFSIVIPNISGYEIAEKHYSKEEIEKKRLEVELERINSRIEEARKVVQAAAQAAKTKFNVVVPNISGYDISEINSVERVTDQQVDQVVAESDKKVEKVIKESEPVDGGTLVI